MPRAIDDELVLRAIDDELELRAVDDELVPRAIDDELVLFAIDDELELRSDSSTCGRYAPHAIAQTHGYVALAKSLRRGLAY